MTYDISLCSSHLDEDALLARLSYSSVNVESGEINDGGAIYEGGSILPGDTWKKVDADRGRQILSGGKNIDTSIGIHLSEKLLKDRLLELATYRTDRAQAYEFPGDIFGTRKELGEALSNVDGIRLVGPLMDLVVGKSKGGLITTTTGDDSQRVGLHLDSWDHIREASGHGQMHARSNRIGYNAGDEDRFLLFVPRSVRMIQDMVIKKGLKREQDIISCFFESYPNEKIYRLQIKPLEFYVAPTENMIHDGSTLGQTSSDIAIFVRGYILNDGKDY